MATEVKGFDNHLVHTTCIGISDLYTIDLGSDQSIKVNAVMQSKKSATTGLNGCGYLLLMWLATVVVG